ncbi:MAG: asparagine synthase (glutamine-hydrolyzing) [Oscillospiraceae bacterium]|nr:asparagine synthase (glutamine-hydrolyzing) [Oscillospiraceae bacterium]
MCGICGFVSKGDQRRNEIVRDMTEKIIHRGPDDVGFFSDDFIAMGFRRLSIVDISGGGQPICNEDENLVLTFNGEVYNHEELRDELVKNGHKFESCTDSEVILHGFEQWGEKVVEHLRGMFAFSIWNRSERELFLARDHFGIKPLHYCVYENDLIYGSEIKSILAFPDFEKKINFSALDNYLSFQYVPPPETLFEGIFCLEPGRFLRFKEGKIEIVRYFEPVFASKQNEIKEATEKIANVLEDSVRVHRMSDVEVGCFLSSGVDSSIIASYFVEKKGFTVGFDEGEKYNEIKKAEDFCGYFGLHHFSKVIAADEFWEAVSPVQYYMDQPLADPSCVALYFLCRLASEHVKVVLSGEGADELFGGYPVYNEPRVFKWYRRFVPQKIRTVLSNLVKKFPYFKGRGFIMRGELEAEKKFIGNAYIFSEEEKKHILKDPNIATNPLNFVKKFYERVKDVDEATKMQYVDMNLWLVGDILLKADRMSMANSLELRVPFLDKKMFDIASKLSSKIKTPRENTKFALRCAAAKRLPYPIAQRLKLGFPIPTRIWLRNKKYYEEVRTKFISEVSKRFFDTDNLCNLLEEHFTGKKDNSRKIWTVYIFIVWYNIYFGNC